MTSSKRFDLSLIRSAAEEAVARSSLRAVAEEIPMSFRGLKDFLDGTTAVPHRGTAEKLTRWYLVRRDASGEVSTGDVAAALTAIRSYINAARTPAARERRRKRVLNELSGSR